MLRLLANAFASSGSKSQRSSQSARPQVEGLEDRQLMAAYVTGGNLIVKGTAANDTVQVYDSGSNYQVKLNGASTSVAKAQVTSGRVYLYGYAGNDNLRSYSTALAVVAYADAGNDSVYGSTAGDLLLGGTGDDYLGGAAGHDRVYGEDGNDRLYGFAGNDALYGGNGDDKLYAGVGTDRVHGDAGNDFLDAGSAAEAVSGGAGSDFNAYVWAVDGARYTDVRQGGAPVCGVLSSLSAAAHSGIDFASRIRYAGNGVYKVGLYDAAGAYAPVTVAFDGTGAADAVPQVEGESWVVLVQRAFLQLKGDNVAAPKAYWAFDVLPAFTGTASETRWQSAGYGDADVTRLQDTLKSGGSAVAWTPYNADRKDLVAPTAPGLVAGHAYTVVSVDQKLVWVPPTIDASNWWRLDLLVGHFEVQTTVTVRNPWGYDGAAASGDKNDGLVTITWAEFQSAMSGYSVNRAATA